MNDNYSKFNTDLFIKYIAKYLILGLIVTISAYYIPLIYKTSLRKPTINEVISIGLIASITMLLIDHIININEKKLNYSS